jgi:uncharacterized protein (TIGR03437 family)
MIRFVTGLCTPPAIARGSIFRVLAPFALALLITAGAQAATINGSTFTLTASAPLTGTSLVLTGQAGMSGVYTGNSAAFSSTISLTGSTPAPFTITVSSGNTLTGTFTFASAAVGGTGTGSLTITGGTGTYAGYTGSFPSVTETGSTSISGTSVSLALTCNGTGTVNTAGGGTTTPVPTITSVVDGASYTSNVVPGAFITVKGTNLGPSSPPTISFPRPTNVGGVKVTFTPVTGGGAATDTYLVYLSAVQINCILPSTVSAGNYNVTVTNGTVSAPVVTQVVASKPAIFTQDTTGTGLAVVFNYISATATFDQNRLTTGTYNGLSSSPAKPGQVLVAYGTGIGPYTAGDNAIGIVHDFSTTYAVAAIVGGVSIPVAFAGIAGFAAEDQINFTLPSNVPTGCSVSLQISVNGALSAATTISIAPSSSPTACVQPGYTTAQLQSLDKGGTINTGGFALSQIVATVPSLGTEKLDSIGGSFSQITGFQLSSSGAQNFSVTTIGSCTVIHAVITSTTTAPSYVTTFDAGTVTLTGPSGTNLTNQQLTETSNAYYYTIGTEGITIPGQPNGSILAGTYNLTGAGGTDVGPFNTSITLGPPFSLNNPLPATVTESAGLTLNWTGGNASDAVDIIGYSGSTSGTGNNQITNATEFICTTTAGQKTFTVPAAVLTLLPTITAAQVTAGTATGALDVTSSVTPATFNATLKKDGSNIPSTFSYAFVTGGSVVYQ